MPCTCCGMSSRCHTHWWPFLQQQQTLADNVLKYHHKAASQRATADAGQSKHAFDNATLRSWEHHRLQCALVCRLLHFVGKAVGIWARSMFMAVDGARDDSAVTAMTTAGHEPLKAATASIPKAMMAEALFVYQTIGTAAVTATSSLHMAQPCLALPAVYLLPHPIHHEQAAARANTEGQHHPQTTDLLDSDL
eukprot:GHUV01016069.1.p1 GENE.GHUV01016069.1~~GHUV01016069.1.p1  ORF type:complete len:193 (-),score=51.60 GHUV01016069.1:165-743(-)